MSSNKLETCHSLRKAPVPSGSNSFPLSLGTIGHSLKKINKYDWDAHPFPKKT